MRFYRVEGFTADEKWTEKNDSLERRRERVRRVALNSHAFNQKLQERNYYFVVDDSHLDISLGIICSDSGCLEKQLLAYLKNIGLELRDFHIEEVTLKNMLDMLRRSDRNDYIDDEDEILEAFDLDRFSSHRFGREFDFGENLISVTRKEDIYRKAAGFLAEEFLIPELDRIYAGKSRSKAGGHPVHYMVQTDDREIRKGMCRLLLEALYANERIGNRRYTFVDFRPGERFSALDYDSLYKSNIGGTMIVRYNANDDSEDDHASAGRETIEILCETMKKYRHQVLTVFCLPRECTKSKIIFYENLGNTCFIELREDFASGDRAKQYLRMLAGEQAIRTDRKLFAGIEAEKGYLATELRSQFDEWYSNKLKSSIYPQYKNTVTISQELKAAKPKGSAYNELMEMTGLSEAKKVILQALNYHKAQKLFADKGMKDDHPAMHMVFTGNPGTAKTTAARLFAQIMKENGLLSKGKLIEAGRADLVGRFVGWTAPTVKKKFEQAKGSVLFIDEAYSLVDDRDGSFGDEAINTIVQEMENHREDVVVIFAGYPDKMEEFLQKNPGLRSRIAFHVPFADYSTDELCSIANLIAGKKGLKIEEEAIEKLAGIFETARISRDFGNGRYVRNVIEKAKMAQAVRLLSMDLDKVTGDDIRTICAADIEPPVPALNKERVPIGFCAA